MSKPIKASKLRHLNNRQGMPSPEIQKALAIKSARAYRALDESAKKEVAARLMPLAFHIGQRVSGTYFSLHFEGTVVRLSPVLVVVQVDAPPELNTGYDPYVKLPNCKAFTIGEPGLVFWTSAQ